LLLSSRMWGHLAEGYSTLDRPRLAHC